MEGGHLHVYKYYGKMRYCGVICLVNVKQSTPGDGPCLHLDMYGNVYILVTSLVSMQSVRIRSECAV